MEEIADHLAIRETLVTLYQNQDLVELRVLNGLLWNGAQHKSRVISGYYSDYDQLACDALELSRFSQGRST